MSNRREVTFYHLTSASLLKAVPSLLLKIYESGKRCLFLCRNENEVIEFDQYLWSFSTKIFIPHATEKDADLDLQPILISDKILFDNSPTTIFSLLDVEDLSKFELAVFMFFGNKNDENVIKMYEKYKKFKSQENIISKLWIQDSATSKWFLEK